MDAGYSSAALLPRCLPCAGLAAVLPSLPTWSPVWALATAGVCGHVTVLKCFRDVKRTTIIIKLLDFTFVENLLTARELISQNFLCFPFSSEHLLNANGNKKIGNLASFFPILASCGHANNKEWTIIHSFSSCYPNLLC